MRPPNTLPVGSVEMWGTLLFHSKSCLEVFEEGSDRKSELIKDIFSTKHSKVPAPEGKYKYTLPLLMWCSGLSWCEVFPSPVTEGSLVFLYCCGGGTVESQWRTTSIWVLQLAPVPWNRDQRDKRTQVTAPPAPNYANSWPQHWFWVSMRRWGKLKQNPDLSALNPRADSGNPAYFNSCSHSITHMTPSVLMGQWTAVLRKKNQAYI